MRANISCNDLPSKRYSRRRDVFDKKPNLPQESEEVTEASDGKCVIVRYKAPCDKGMKEYNVRMTIDELQNFIE